MNGPAAFYASHVDDGDLRIAEAERRVSSQERLVSRLRLNGHPTGYAETLLTTMTNSLDVMRQTQALARKA